MNGSVEVERVRGWLRDAQRVAVLTGAGMSAESGIATFRDALTGLWSRFDPAQLASEEGFRADPRLVWDWYAERRDSVRRAEPNAGHVALATFARQRPGVLTVITQNVDDLHQRAGVVDAIRLHGDILADRWLDPCARAARGSACDVQWAEPGLKTVPAHRLVPGEGPGRPRPGAGCKASPGRPPRCAECGNLLRPDVVWFGEMLPFGAIDAAEAAAQHCDVMLVVGTSGVVWPAAGLAAMARRRGAKVVIVNPNESDIDADAHVVLRGTAAALLPRLLGDD